MAVVNPGGSAQGHKGLFLFFLMGLFLLQVVFAFTIHGDIGPRELNAGTGSRVAAPVLVGHIDAILNGRAPSGLRTVAVGGHPTPVPGLAPAKLDLTPPVATLVEKTPIQPTTTATQAGPHTFASATPTGSRFHDYTVRPGDTLQSISRRFYGSTHMVVPLVRINRLQSERGLHVGQTLRLPRKGMKSSGA